MSEMRLFRWKSNGVVDTLPADYADHPVFGEDLEPYEPSDEYEEDKVVLGHEVPVDQRGQVVANPVDPNQTPTEGN